MCRTLVITLVLRSHFAYVYPLVLCSSFRSLDQGWQNCMHIHCHNFADWCQQRNFICEDATTFMWPRHSLHITTGRPVVRNYFLGGCGGGTWRFLLESTYFSIAISNKNSPPPKSKFQNRVGGGRGGHAPGPAPLATGLTTGSLRESVASFLKDSSEQYHRCMNMKQYFEHLGIVLLFLKCIYPMLKFLLRPATLKVCTILCPQEMTKEHFMNLLAN